MIYSLSAWCNKVHSWHNLLKSKMTVCITFFLGIGVILIAIFATKLFPRHCLCENSGISPQALQRMLLRLLSPWNTFIPLALEQNPDQRIFKVCFLMLILCNYSEKNFLLLSYCPTWKKWSWILLHTLPCKYPQHHTCQPWWNN